MNDTTINSPTPTDFAGAGVLVTGGSSGLGAETAARMAALGAHVVIAGRSRARGSSVADEIGATFVQADVTDEDQVSAAVDLAAQAPRGLRFAVSAAGSAVVAKTLGRTGPHDLGSFQDQLNVNLVGAFNLLRLAAASMAGNEPESDGSRGAVVLTASVAAYEGQKGQVAYAAAKGGITSMVLPAARDLAREGIRVAGIAPGVFDTPFMDLLTDEAKVGIAKAIPFPARLGHAAEFAALVEHIASNTFINGEVIRLDGGLRLGAS